jgi:hypothetical protein
MDVGSTGGRAMEGRWWHWGRPMEGGGWWHSGRHMEDVDGTGVDP